MCGAEPRCGLDTKGGAGLAPVTHSVRQGDCAIERRHPISPSLSRGFVWTRQDYRDRHRHRSGRAPQRSWLGWRYSPSLALTVRQARPWAICCMAMLPKATLYDRVGRVLSRDPARLHTTQPVVHAWRPLTLSL